MAQVFMGWIPFLSLNQSCQSTGRNSSTDPQAVKITQLPQNFLHPSTFLSVLYWGNRLTQVYLKSRQTKVAVMV